jgi:hypothetical protein
MIPKIEPGEMIFVVTGITPVMKGEHPKITQKLLEEVARLPKTIKELAEQCLGSIKYRSSPVPSYDEQLAYFNAPLDPGYVQDIVSKFPDEAMEFAVPYSLIVQSAVEHLRTEFPRSTYETFVGPRPLTPDDLRVWKFNARLDMLDDPLKLFALVSTGALLKSQVEPLDEILPTFLAACKAALKDALIDRIAANPKYLVPPRIELASSVLTGRKVDIHGSPRPPAKAAPAAPAEPPAAEMSQAEKAAAV